MSPCTRAERNILVKLSVTSFTARFWGSCRRAFAAILQTRGRKTIVFSTMAKLPLTHQLLFKNSWLPKTLQWFPTPLFVWPCHLRVFYISEV